MSGSVTAATPLLSVIVPAYRVERYLPGCLASILADPSPELEVLVVDDRSPDRSGQLADAYARSDPRVRVRHLTTNLGLGRARNLGIDHARGRYLWFVDGDDWLTEGALATVLARLAVSRPDVLMVDHAVVTVDGRATRSAPAGVLAGDGVPRPLTERPELLALAHSACTKVVRRGLLDETGLRFHPGWYEDSAYSHPLLLSAARIDTVDAVCYCYRQRPGGGITHSVSARHFDVFAQYERMWRAAGRTGRAYRQFRAELFRLMIDHLLVIAGNPRRLPPSLRRDFFRRMARDYRRRLPAGGYPAPEGLAGLKHRLVRWNAYELYAGLRTARRLTFAVGGLRRRAGEGLPGRGRSAQPGCAVDIGAVGQVETGPAGQAGMVGAERPHPVGQLLLPPR